MANRDRVQGFAFSYPDGKKIRVYNGKITLTKPKLQEASSVLDKLDKLGKRLMEAQAKLFSLRSNKE